MSFDRLAPHYRWMERVLAGDRLQACRTSFMTEMQGARRVLLLGEGHGRFLAELIGAPGEREVLVVDGSAGMLAQARRGLERHGGGGSGSRVEFCQADVLEWECREPVDGVVTHFFLDCFTAGQLERLIPKVAGWVKPGGWWQVADFQVPTRRLLAIRARLVLALAYGFFRVFARLPARRLVPPQPLLAAGGWGRVGRREFNFGLLYSELWRRPCV